MKQGWTEVALGDVTEPVSKRVPEGSPSGAFTYIDLSSVDQQLKEIVGPVVVPVAEAPSRARQLVAAGDVLVSTVRPNLNAVAVVPPELAGATASTGFTVLRPRQRDVDHRYVFHWVKNPRFVASMVRLATGASYPAVSDRVVKASEIPLPPLEEQKRIAAILDKADELLAKRRAAIAHLDSLTQAIFLDMFGDPVTNPKDWPLAALQDLVEAVIDCPHSTPRWSADGVVCLRTSNLGRGTWDWSETRFVDADTYMDRSARGELTTGDVVLSREGTVGIAAIVPQNVQMCMGQRLVQVKPGHGSIGSAPLLWFLLEALDPRTIGRLLVGSTAKHLNVRDLKKLPTFVLPPNLQARFSDRAARVESLRVSAAAAVGSMAASTVALQARAFRGEL